MKISSRSKRKNKPTVLSMFSGCGGMDLGFTQAGFEIVWANDNNPDACTTYRENIGSIIEDDIANIPVPEIEDLDCLIAGFPCQPYSNAGNRNGITDRRGNLYEYCIKFIQTLRPKFTVFENVRGLLSIKGNNKCLIEDIADKLIELNYEVHLNLVNAAHYGVPQNRLRVFIIGIKKDAKLGAYRFPSQIEGKDLTIGSNLNVPDNIPNQLDLLRLNPQALEIGRMVPEGGSWKNIPYEKLPDRLKFIRDNMRRYRWPNFYRRFHRNEIAGTVTAAFKPENAGVWHPIEGRVLSAREIARIQSFPDDFVFNGRSIKAIYEMIGNAVPPLLSKAFAESILISLANKDRQGILRDYYTVKHSGKPIKPGEPEMLYVPTAVQDDNLQRETVLELCTYTTS
ncbi:MAG: DNA cytosine methyltransferase [Armatimonadota bacterium]